MSDAERNGGETGAAPPGQAGMDEAIAQADVFAYACYLVQYAKPIPGTEDCRVPAFLIEEIRERLPHCPTLYEAWQRSQAKEKEGG